MRLIQVTLGAGATQISPYNSIGKQIYCSFLIVQNNAAGNVRVGDNTVSATKGILLLPGPGGGSLTGQMFRVEGTLLPQWYLFGTQGQLIDVLYEDSQ